MNVFTFEFRVQYTLIDRLQVNGKLARKVTYL